MNNNIERKSSAFALLPMLIFVLCYVGTGTVLSLQGADMAFYQMPIPVPVAIGVIFAFIFFKGDINSKFDSFIKGCSDENIIIMIVIYIIAGAFAGVAKSMGGVDSTVNLGLTLIPIQFITVGVFIMSGIIATATGSGMGTISAVLPIAIGITQKTTIGLPIMIGAVIGGAMLGDNMSIVSDTTIVATRTQNVEMRDKFRMNLMIALPPALITFILLLVLGRPDTAVAFGDLSFSLIKVIPYFFVLVLAIMGVNVLVVLTSGVLMSGAIGVIGGDITMLQFAKTSYDGATGMSELIICTLLCGGLVKMVTDAGGLNFVVDKLSKFAKNKKSAQVSIAALVSMADIAVANNTIAILVSGSIAKQLSTTYKVDPRKSASLLDIFACVFQGILPYSAQLIVAGTLVGGMVSPVEMIPFLWYPMLLGIFGIISIFVPYADGAINKDPWNFEHDLPQSKVDKLISTK